MASAKSALSRTVGWVRSVNVPTLVAAAIVTAIVNSLMGTGATFLRNEPPRTPVIREQTFHQSEAALATTTAGVPILQTWEAAVNACASPPQPESFMATPAVRLPVVVTGSPPGVVRSALEGPQASPFVLIVRGEIFNATEESAVFRRGSADVVTFRRADEVDDCVWVRRVTKPLLPLPLTPRENQTAGGPLPLTTWSMIVRPEDELNEAVPLAYQGVPGGRLEIAPRSSGQFEARLEFSTAGEYSLRVAFEVAVGGEEESRWIRGPMFDLTVRIMDQIPMDRIRVVEPS